MDSMDDVRKFLNKPEEYHPLPNGKFTDGFGNMLDAHSVVYAITAERDRLAAENKQLAIDYELSVKSRNWQYDAHIACKNELAAANATLDRLREVVPKVLPPHMSWKDSLDGARAILYPPETTNDDR